MHKIPKNMHIACLIVIVFWWAFLLFIPISFRVTSLTMRHSYVVEQQQEYYHNKTAQITNVHILNVFEVMWLFSLKKFQYGCLAAILKLTLLKINRLLHTYISIVPLKFGVDIQSQTTVSGNQKIQYGRQAAILKVTSLKIYRLLPMTTINMHMKFEIEIPKQTWLTLRKPCHLQSPETEKSNMATRRPFWKWRR